MEGGAGLYAAGVTERCVVGGEGRYVGEEPRAAGGREGHGSRRARLKVGFELFPARFFIVFQLLGKKAITDRGSLIACFFCSFHIIPGIVFCDVLISANLCDFSVVWLHLADS